MKKLLFITMFMISITSVSQTQIKLGAFKASNGVTYMIGDIITTAATQSKKTITTKDLNEVVNLPNMNFIIIKIKYSKYRHFRKIIFTVQPLISKKKFYIDIEEAIKEHDIK